MFALEPHLVQRLQAALPAWQVQGLSDPRDRKPAAKPVCVVAFDDTAGIDAPQTAVRLAANWRVALVTRRGAGAATLLDGAVAEAMAQLHNWRPPAVADRQWGHMAFIRAEYLPEADDAQLGLHLIFQTAATYHGVPAKPF